MLTLKYLNKVFLRDYFAIIYVFYIYMLYIYIYICFLYIFSKCALYILVNNNFFLSLIYLIIFNFLNYNKLF